MPNNTLRLEYVDPSSLSANPANWRRHPEAQRRATKDAIDRVGWVKPLIFNEATGRLLDGHMRRELYGGSPVPVVVGSWPADQEALILATLDPLASMAEVDAIAFDSLLRKLDVGSEDLLTLLDDVATDAGMYRGDEDDEPEKPPRASDVQAEAQAEAAEEEKGTPQGVPDALWPSDDEWGIPRLDVRRQADALEYPWNQWRKVSQTKSVVGTMMFYTDDDRFKSLWRSPDAIFRTGVTAVVEPNYTTDVRMPRALVLHDVYRKRWLGRYWQSKGLRLWVDVNVMPECFDLAFMGVPKGWRAFSTRSHGDPGRLVAQWEAAARHVETDDFSFIVWGVGKAVRELCTARDWQFVDIGSLFGPEK